MDGFLVKEERVGNYNVWQYYLGYASMFEFCAYFIHTFIS